jgi:hypothetical protein
LVSKYRLPRTTSLKMKAVRSPETLLSNHYPTRCNDLVNNDF